MLTNSFIIGDCQRIGFISGLVWLRQSSLDYQNYIQCWYGSEQHGPLVFRLLHREIQNTRDFSQHKLIELFHHLCNILIYIIGIFQALALQDYTDDKEGQYELQRLLITTIFAIIIFTVKGSSICLFSSIGKSLKDKIKKSIDEANVYLARLGYIAKFPMYRKKLFYFIPLCIQTEMTRIQIFNIISQSTTNTGISGQMSQINQDIKNLLLSA